MRGRPKTGTQAVRASSPPITPYYTNCDAVRHAGADPLYPGEPGFRPELDRDGDGERANRTAATATPVPPQTVSVLRQLHRGSGGRDPIHKGDPGYSRKLDRDGDGIGCE